MHLFIVSVQSQSLLGHPHLWVRLAASQLLGFILAALDTEKVERLLKNPDESLDSGYIYSDPVDTLRSLTLDLIAQLYPDMTLEDLSDQVIKNLVFIAKLLKSTDTKDKESEEIPNETDKINKLSLFWLVKKMRKIVNVEVSQSPKSTCVVSIFWIL